MPQPGAVLVSDRDRKVLETFGLIQDDEIAYYVKEACYAEDMRSGVVRRILIEGLGLEARRSLLCD